MAYTDYRGYSWDEYSIKFESPEGTFTTSIFAISFEHAELQLQAIKETGKIVGKLVSRTKAGE